MNQLQHTCGKLYYGAEYAQILSRKRALYKLKYFSIFLNKKQQQTITANTKMPIAFWKSYKPF